MGLHEAPRGEIFGSGQEQSSGLDFAHQREALVVDYFDKIYVLLSQLHAANETPTLLQFTTENLRKDTGADQFEGEINRVISQQQALEEALRDAFRGETPEIRRRGRQQLPLFDALISYLPNWATAYSSEQMREDYERNASTVGNGWERKTHVDAYTSGGKNAESKLYQVAGKGEQPSGFTSIEMRYHNGTLSDDYAETSSLLIEAQGHEDGRFLWKKAVVYFLSDGGTVITMTGYDPEDHNKSLKVEFAADGTRLTNEKYEARTAARRRRYSYGGGL